MDQLYHKDEKRRDDLDLCPLPPVLLPSACIPYIVVFPILLLGDLFLSLFKFSAAEMNHLWVYLVNSFMAPDPSWLAYWFFYGCSWASHPKPNTQSRPQRAGCFWNVLLQVWWLDLLHHGNGEK